MADDDASLMVEMTTFSDLDSKFRKLSREIPRYQPKLAEYEDGFDDRVATLKASVIGMRKFYDAWLLMEKGLWDVDKKMSELHNCLKKFVDKLTADAEGSYESDTELLNLQTSIESSIKTLSSLKDRAAACKQRYNAQLFIISVIESQHFPLLRKCIFGSMGGNIASIPDESWDIFYDVLKIVPSSQLRYMLAAQPTSNITVVQCQKLEKGVAQTVRFAYWMHNEDVVISIKEDEWSTLMGPVKNQLGHDLCWAFVIAELVSAVRYLKRNDLEKVEYSCQDLADFADPQRRSEMKVKQDGKEHYCYSFPVSKGLDYVREFGIAREVDHPFQVECKKDVGAERAERSELNLGYIGEMVSLDTFEEVVRTLKDHPVAASIPVFEPEFSGIGDKIYRGPTSPISRYVTMHAINLVGGGKDEITGEKYLKGRNTHGKIFGEDGNFKFSMEVMMMCLSRDQHAMFLEYPMALACQFVYPKMLSKEEEDEKKKRKQKQKEEMKPDRKKRNTG